MAYINNYLDQEDEQNKFETGHGLQTFQPTQSSVGNKPYSSFAPTNAGGSGGSNPEQPAQVGSSPTGYVNLQRYLDANSGAGGGTERMGGAVVNQLSPDVGKAQTDIAQTRQLGGATGYQTDIAKAQGEVDTAKTTGGQQSYLQQAYGKGGNYNQGDQSLDAFLAGQSNTLGSYEQQNNNLAGQLGAAQGQYEKQQAEQNQAATTNFQQAKPTDVTPTALQTRSTQNDPRAWAKEHNIQVDGQGNVRVPKVGGGYSEVPVAQYMQQYRSQYGDG